MRCFINYLEVLYYYLSVSSVLYPLRNDPQVEPKLSSYEIECPRETEMIHWKLGFVGHCYTSWVSWCCCRQIRDADRDSHTAWWVGIRWCRQASTPNLALFRLLSLVHCNTSYAAASNHGMRVCEGNLQPGDSIMRPNIYTVHHTVIHISESIHTFSPLPVAYTCSI